MRASGTRNGAPRVTSDGILFPLDFVYARSGVELPQVKAIDPDDIPLPYRSLLVHRTDMTLTLERHFGGHQDIEWAIDADGELFGLQSRPVTVAPSKPGPAKSAMQLVMGTFGVDRSS